MAIVDLMNDADAKTDLLVRGVFADIRVTRGLDVVTDLRRDLTSDPGPLKETWAAVKTATASGVFHPIFRVGA